MELKIISPKYGEFTVFFDDDISDLILKYKWSIQKKSGRSKTFYVIGWIKGSRKLGYMHQLVMGFPKLLPKQNIDHKDGNGLNNKKENLRIGSVSQNISNCGLRKNNTTGFKGVTLLKGRYFCASIKVNREKINGGLFNTALEAAKKYNEMAVKYFGEFANLNDVSSGFIGYKEAAPLNFRLGIGNTTGYRGVSPTPKRNTFMAVIGVNGKRICVGHFKTSEEAAIAYNAAVLFYGLPESRLNKL